MNKISLAWEKVFEIKNFDLSKDLHFISAVEIKEITKMEPRIMAKVDASVDLPEVFKKNNYFLLPVKNGQYAIVRGDGFHLLEEKGLHMSHKSRIKFNLTTASRGMGEMQYLDYSFNSGALEKVLGISPLYQSIRGREYSKQFSFKVNNTELNVNSVQIEVDSGLEGEDTIVLIEAKIRTPEDFIVRQLFYPYNHFKVISPNKKIVPVFFTYEPATKLYNFWVYEFTDQNNYNSIKLKEVCSLTIDLHNELELSDIKPKASVVYKDLVPQANDLSKVIEFVFKVNEGVNSYKDIADYFKFDTRQSSYYREAAEAIGLIASEKGVYKLTSTARHLVSLSVDKRNIFVVELLSDFNLVKSGLDILKQRNHLSRADIENLIKQNSQLTGTTIPRRAASLVSWFKWIAEVSGAFKYEDKTFKVN